MSLLNQLHKLQVVSCKFQLQAACCVIEFAESQRNPGFAIATWPTDSWPTKTNEEKCPFISLSLSELRMN